MKGVLVIGDTMNSLVQQQSGLIGSEEAIAALEQKASAKVLVLGDSHGDHNVVLDIILWCGNEVDALLFCGDGFCDIIACIEQSINDEKVKKALPSVIIPVKGNGDSLTYSTESLSSEDEHYLHYSLPTRISCEVAGRGVFIAHGDHYRVDMGTDTVLAAAHAVDADMAFFGHTHRTHWEENGGTLILNPGSCSRPRSTLPPSFALVSFPGKHDRFTIEYFGIEKTLFKNHKFMPLDVHMT